MILQAVQIGLRSYKITQDESLLKKCIDLLLDYEKLTGSSTEAHRLLQIADERKRNKERLLREVEW